MLPVASFQHTSHVSNDSLRHGLALLLVLFALAPEQAAVWQHNHSSSGFETSPSELADPCRANVLIHTAERNQQRLRLQKITG